MSKRIFVQAAPGRRVLDALGHPVPTGPFPVNQADPWWAAALRAGDVTEATAPEPEQTRQVQTVKPAVTSEQGEKK